MFIWANIFFFYLSASVALPCINQHVLCVYQILLHNLKQTQMGQTLSWIFDGLVWTDDRGIQTVRDGLDPHLNSLSERSKHQRTPSSLFYEIKCFPIIELSHTSLYQCIKTANNIVLASCFENGMDQNIRNTTWYHAEQFITMLKLQTLKGRYVRFLLS